MRVHICDDDKSMMIYLTNQCKDYFEEAGINVEITGTSQWERELFDDGNKVKMPDLLLLDIEMPGLSGIEIKDVLERMEHKPYIIFVSSHDELMGETHGRNVLGFIKKADINQKLRKLLDKAVDFYQEQFRMIPLGDGKMMDCRDIMYINANSVIQNHSEIVCTSKRSTFRRTLKEWEELLPEGDFFRLGNSSIVNLAFVERQEKESVIMKDGTRLKLSRQKKQEFQRLRMIYIRRKGRVL